MVHSAKPHKLRFQLHHKRPQRVNTYHTMGNHSIPYHTMTFVTTLLPKHHGYSLSETLDQDNEHENNVCTLFKIIKVKTVFLLHGGIIILSIHYDHILNFAYCDIAAIDCVCMSLFNVYRLFPISVHYVVYIIL